MKKIIYIITAMILFVGIYACTDESTFNNFTVYDLQKGGFVKFSGAQPDGIVFEPQNIVYSGELIDANNNLSSYTLALKATIAGTTYFIDEYATYTSFPATLSITSQEIADAAGVSVDDLSFGDLFTFTGIATTTDGRVFNGERPTYEDGVLGKGNTEPTLEVASYFNAMKIVMAIACPPSPPGVYTIDMHDSYGDGWQTDDGNGGSGIQITVDDEIIEFGMCSPYGSSNTGTFSDEALGGCTPNDGYDATTTVEIPAGASLILWEFPGDQYGEISFEIYDPEGNLIGEYGENTPAGLLVLCDADPST